MNEVRDVPFAVFETEDGQLLGKFKKTSLKKTIKLVNYLETQIDIIRQPTSKCHRLRTILEKRGVKRHNGRRERKI